MRRSLDGGRCSTSLGSAPWWGTGPRSSAFGLILPAGQASPHPRCPAPEHLPQLSVLGGARGGRDISSTCDRAGGSLAGALQALPRGKSGQDMPASRGGSLIPISSLISHALKVRVPSSSPRCSAESPGCVGRTLVSRVDLPSTEE